MCIASAILLILNFPHASMYKTLKYFDKFMLSNEDDKFTTQLCDFLAHIIASRS